MSSDLLFPEGSALPPSPAPVPPTGAAPPPSPASDASGGVAGSRHPMPVGPALNPIAGDVAIRLERADDAAAVEALSARAFGPGRFARAAYRVREGAGSAGAIGLVAEVGVAGTAARFAGAVRLTPVCIGPAAAFLLGPLAVDPALASRGIGRALVAAALAEALASPRQAVLLVGDLAYYRGSGFVPISTLRVMMPGPVAPHRLLAHGLGRIDPDALAGPVRADPPGLRA